MRILLVANFAQKSLGSWCYNSDRRIKSGLIRANHLVWDFSDRDVSRASNPFGSRKMGIGATNRKFLETVDNLLPDIILLAHADIIKSSTLAEVRQKYKNTKIIVYNFDPLFTANNVAAIKDRMDVADAIFITTGGEGLKQFKTPKNIASFIPNPTDIGIDSGKAFEKTGQEFDVFQCIGGAVSDTDPRVVAVQHLLANYPQIKIDYYGMLGAPNLLGGRFLETVQNKARMGLNLSRRNDVYLYCSDRCAGLMGNGLLTFQPRGIKFDKFFDESQVAFFNDFDELGRKIMEFKKDDARRQAVAEAGWKQYHKLFASNIVTQFMVETVLGQKYSHDYAWADEVLK